MLFLEADEQTLLTRYKETRRRHPLAPRGSVAEGIARERELLAPLRERADVVIDTSGLTAAMLRRKLADELLPTRTPGRLAVTFQSFGFKYGPSRDPDLLLDVRFLPNPHYEPELRPLTGRRRAHRRVHQPRRRARRVLRPAAPAARLPAAAVPGRGQGTPGGGDRVHRAAATARWRSPSIWRGRYDDASEYLVEVVHRDVTQAGVIDHIGFEVSDLERSSRFYDAVLYALGARRMFESEHAVAYGVNAPVVWIVVRGSRAGRRATGTWRCRRAARRRSTPPTPAGSPTAAATTAPPGQRPQYGRRYYAAYLRDPDGLRVEVVSRR